MPEKWRYIVDKDVSSAYGLAIDEMLSHSVAYNGSAPILHLYNFLPSVIVGRYQNIEAAIDIEECHRREIEYNRRHTGGGTVLMGPDQLALGFAIPLSHNSASRSIRQMFGLLAGVISDALRKMGVDSTFRPKNDLEVGGKKIAGLSASLEERDAFFFHMSLLVDFDMELMVRILNTPREKLADKAISCFSQRMTTIRDEIGQLLPLPAAMEAIKDSFGKKFGVEFEDTQLSRWEEDKVRDLIQSRYGSKDWIFSVKHPPGATGHARKKTPGGMLDVYLTLAGGSIESVLITGDFFSTSETINRIESTLKWTSADRENVEKRLNQAMGDESIYNVDAATLTDIIMMAKKRSRRVPVSGLR
jgi:lipoate-protein ligase A